MLRTLIEKYYAEDDLSEEQFAEIQSSREKAEKALSADSVHLFSETHWLHDWYVCGLSIDCRDEKRFCRITFTNKTRRIVLLCSEVISIYGVGEWVSASAQYPGAGTNDSFAQVLALWLEHKRNFECYLLLDNERYIVLQSRKIELFEQ